jgi:hypothetical protein
MLTMKKRSGYLFAIFPIVLTLGIYIVFYERIATKPANAGFWMILALGMSIGIAITRIVQIQKEKNV